MANLQLLCAITNYGTLGPSAIYTFTLKDFNLDGKTYDVLDLYDNAKPIAKDIDVLTEITVRVNNSGVVFLKALIKEA